MNGSGAETVPRTRLRDAPAAPRGRLRAVLLALLLPLSFLLPACGELDMGVEIKSADEVTTTVDFRISTADAGGVVTKETLCAALDTPSGSGTTSTSYEKDGYIGCRITSTGTLDDLVRKGSAKVDGDRVTIRFTTSSLGTTTGTTTGTLDRMSLRVTFPGRVISHTGNASVEGRTVTWSNPKDLSAAGGVQATGSMATGLAAVPAGVWIAIGAGAAVLALAVLAIVLGRRRRAGRRPLPPSVTGGYPGGPGRYPGGAHPPASYPPQDYRPAQNPDGYPPAPYPGDPRGATPPPAPPRYPDGAARGPLPPSGGPGDPRAGVQQGFWSAPARLGAEADLDTAQLAAQDDQPTERVSREDDEVTAQLPEHPPWHAAPEDPPSPG